MKWILSFIGILLIIHQCDATDLCPDQLSYTWNITSVFGVYDYWTYKTQASFRAWIGIAVPPCLTMFETPMYLLPQSSETKYVTYQNTTYFVTRVYGNELSTKIMFAQPGNGNYVETKLAVFNCSPYSTPVFNATVPGYACDTDLDQHPLTELGIPVVNLSSGPGSGAGSAGSVIYY